MFTGPRQLTTQDVRSTSTTKSEQFGSIGVTQDGRVYRYGSAASGAALNEGELAVNADLVADHTNKLVQAAAAVGDTEVSVSLGATAATADQYAEGFLNIQDNAGEAVAYLIASHGAAALSTTLKVFLSEPIVQALTTSSEYTLMKSPWKDTVIAATDQADAPVGVPNVEIAASSFGYLQTRGVCSVKCDEAFARGAALTTGTGTAGEVEALDAAGEPQIGVALQTGVDNEHTAVFLTID